MCEEEDKGSSFHGLSATYSCITNSRVTNTYSSVPVSKDKGKSPIDAPEGHMSPHFPTGEKFLAGTMRCCPCF